MTDRPRRKSDAARRANQVIRGRTMLIMLLLGVASFTVLFWKLYDLQINRHDELKAEAVGQQTDSMVISASRGTIYDKNGEIMAISYSTETVLLDPGGVQDFVESQEQKIQDAAEEAAEKGAPYTAPEVLDQAYIARGLSRILDVEEETILEHLENTANRYWEVKKKVDQDVADEVRRFINGEIDDEGNQLTTVDEDGNTVLISTGGRPTRLQGISLTPDTKRLYPFGSLAGNVIGFVNANNMGAYGLEASYDDVLSGSTGLTITPTNVNGTPLLFSGGEQMFDAENGSSLVLTLDTNVQYALEKGLESMLDKYDAANGGTGIVMDVNTGGIVAMASYPNYDPGDFSTIYTEGLQAELDAALAEIQQNSNTTYRVYDYGRRGADGKLRPLHIAKALDVTNLRPIAPTVQYPAEAVAGGTVRKLEACKYFASDVVTVHGTVAFTVGTESFHHLLFLSGEATLQTESGSYPVKKGSSVLLPAGLGAYTVTGESVQYVVTRVDEKLS